MKNILHVSTIVLLFTAHSLTAMARTDIDRDLRRNDGGQVRKASEKSASGDISAHCNLDADHKDGKHDYSSQLGLTKTGF